MRPSTVSALLAAIASISSANAQAPLILPYESLARIGTPVAIVFKTFTVHRTPITTPTSPVYAPVPTPLMAPAVPSKKPMVVTKQTVVTMVYKSVYSYFRPAPANTPFDVDICWHDAIASEVAIPKVKRQQYTACPNVDFVDPSFQSGLPPDFYSPVTWLRPSESPPPINPIYHKDDFFTIVTPIIHYPAGGGVTPRKDNGMEATRTVGSTLYREDRPTPAAEIGDKVEKSWSA